MQTNWAHEPDGKKQRERPKQNPDEHRKLSSEFSQPELFQCGYLSESKSTLSRKFWLKAMDAVIPQQLYLNEHTYRCPSKEQRLVRDCAISNSPSATIDEATRGKADHFFDMGYQLKW